jgi:hypothetical protein
VGFLIKTKNIKMAICNGLTTPLAKTCDLNAGGIKKILVADFTEFSPTITGGEITGITPAGPNAVISTVATVNIATSGFVRILVSVTIPGNQTSIFTTGRWFYFTYNVMQIDGVTVTATYWSGAVLSSSYNAGTNTTTIVPDFLGFTPLIGQSSDPAPPNTNQTVSTFAFFEIETNKNVCNFQETTAIDLAAGTTYFNQVVTLVLTRRDTTKRTYINKLIAGQKDLLLIVLDSNNIYWIIGLIEGARVTGIDGGTGVQKTDRNGYEVVFTASERLQAYEIDYAAISPYLILA